ncbi:translation initiation factor IF-2 [Spiroplasma endosymbiont of Crioceris asparagi]|uniref:translation initiation factor IF-2 n=1 Tax=Spiroplasma endosymbiont of Crioceris asparagi TaxID=3066286 RepID=UPI0030CCF791
MAKNNNKKIKVSKNKSIKDTKELKNKLSAKSAIGLVDGIFVYNEPLSVSEFAEKIGKSASEVVKYFFLKGNIINQNTQMTEEQMGEICLEFGFDFKKEVKMTKENLLDTIKFDINLDQLKERPPVVTIMGHVDHGKTTLLDAIRKSNIVGGEFGGITQHIGAYQVEHENKFITFIDTPGHEAFSEMRARGSQATDIVIIVVAADEGLKPQTIEAINHAKAAHVPIIVFINKMDKPNANPDKVKSELMQYELVAEDYGGDVPFVEGSAIKKMGLNQLLDTILLIAELNEYKADYENSARGVVLEAYLDRSKGPVATVLVQNGVLNIRDTVVAGGTFGSVKSLEDENKKRLKNANPSKPIIVIGLNEVPRAGDKFLVLGEEKLARDIAKAQALRISEEMKTKAQNFSLEAIKHQIELNELKVINIILKADTQGTIEAVKSSLMKINVNGIRINIVHAGVGAISNSDVTLALASESLLYGFNVRPIAQVREKAEEDGITIRLHNIIYKLIEEVEELAKGFIEPEYTEVIVGEAEVRELFRHSEIGTIAGCRVVNGAIPRGSKVHIIRDGVLVYTGELSSLKNKKDDIKEAREGMECGLTIKNYNDIKQGDLIEAFKLDVKE